MHLKPLIFCLYKWFSNTWTISQIIIPLWFLCSWYNIDFCHILNLIINVFFFLWALKGLTFLCFSWFQHCRICYDHRLQYNQGCMLILSYTFNPFWCHQLIFPTTNLSTFIWRYVPIRTCAVVRITRTLTWTIMSFVSVYTLPKNTFLHKIHKFWSL